MAAKIPTMDSQQPSAVNALPGQHYVTLEVEGRPASFATAAEAPWKEAVRRAVADFHGRLGIESGRETLEAKAWTDAAAEFRDRVLETGAERVDASRRLGSETFDRARSVTSRLSGGIAERTPFRRRADPERPDEEGV